MFASAMWVEVLFYADLYTLFLLVLLKLNVIWWMPGLSWVVILLRAYPKVGKIIFISYIHTMKQCDKCIKYQTKACRVCWLTLSHYSHYSTTFNEIAALFFIHKNLQKWVIRNMHESKSMMVYLLLHCCNFRNLI